MRRGARRLGEFGCTIRRTHGTNLVRWKGAAAAAAANATEERRPHAMKKWQPCDEAHEPKDAAGTRAETKGQQSSNTTPRGKPNRRPTHRQQRAGSSNKAGTKRAATR